MPFILMSVGGLLTGRSSGNLRRRLSGIPPVSQFIVFQGKAAVAASVILAGLLTPILLCLRNLVLNQCSCSTHQGCHSKLIPCRFPVLPQAFSINPIVCLLHVNRVRVGRHEKSSSGP